MKLVVGSKNPGKLRELKRILSELPVEWLSLSALGKVPEVLEDGATYRENAEKKARTWARATGWWVLADDSGLEVDALQGAPGVHSARYAGEEADPEKNNRKLLGALRHTPTSERTARFRCVVALAAPRGDLLVGEGVCEGHILEAPRGEQGFGYDPVFFCREGNICFGEADAARKDRYSHRAAALRDLARQLKERWPEGLPPPPK